MNNKRLYESIIMAINTLDRCLNHGDMEGVNDQIKYIKKALPNLKLANTDKNGNN